MATLMEWVRHLVLLVVLISFFELLAPKNALQPYVRLVGGLVILAAVVSPLVALVRGDDLWRRAAESGGRWSAEAALPSSPPALAETERRLRNELFAARLAAYLEEELTKAAGRRVRAAVRVSGNGRVERVTLAVPPGTGKDLRRRAAALSGLDPAHVWVVEEAIP
ncbi:MAG TPA: stage III sporulation protein AF [Firmicutes bacterium]|nr:stage III sporulation protein AF [Bacillota bacterium]